jgi:hypothetical protein
MVRGRIHPEAAMRKEQAVYMLRSGRVKEWNAYREANPTWVPDLSHEDLSDVSFVTSEVVKIAKQLEQTEDEDGKRLENVRPVLSKYAYNLEGARLIGSRLPSPISNYLITIELNTTLWHDTIYHGADAYMESRRFQFCRFDGATYDLSTILPDWLDPKQQGMILVLEVGDEASGQTPPSVFISYAWADDNVVAAIDRCLQLKGVNTRIDKRDFSAGSRIRDEILRLMQASDVILIFFSKRAKDRTFALFERETAADLEIDAKLAGRKPPRIIYVVMDETPLPSPVEINRLAVMAKGKTIRGVCEELYINILQISRRTPPIDPASWDTVI